MLFYSKYGSSYISFASEQNITDFDAISFKPLAFL